MSVNASNTVNSVDSAMYFIVGISVVLLLGITAAMVYFVFKYNRKKGVKPKNIHGSLLLESIWIGIPTLLVLGMFYYGLKGFNEIKTIPENALKIKTTGRMWQWQFDYKNGVKTDTLYVPVNQPVLLELKSIDVNHSLYIPAFRVKEDVIGSQVNYLSFTPLKIGAYNIACAEYCGLGHSRMYTKCVVLSRKDYRKWLNNQLAKRKGKGFEKKN